VTAARPRRRSPASPGEATETKASDRLPEEAQAALAPESLTGEADGAARAAVRRHAGANRAGRRRRDERSDPPADSKDRRVVVAFVMGEVGDQTRDDLVERPGRGGG